MSSHSRFVVFLRATFRWGLLSVFAISLAFGSASTGICQVPALREIVEAQKLLDQSTTDPAIVPAAREAAKAALTKVLRVHSQSCELRNSLHRRHTGEPLRVDDVSLMAFANECSEAARIHAHPSLELAPCPDRIEAMRLAWCGFSIVGDAVNSKAAALRTYAELNRWIEEISSDRDVGRSKIQSDAPLVFDILLGMAIVMDESRDYAGALKCIDHAEGIANDYLAKDGRARFSCFDSRGLILISYGRFAEALQSFRSSLAELKAMKPQNLFSMVDTQTKIIQTLLRVGDRRDLPAETEVLAQYLSKIKDLQFRFPSIELRAHTVVIETCLDTEVKPELAAQSCMEGEYLVHLVQQNQAGFDEQIGALSFFLASAQWQKYQDQNAEAERFIHLAEQQLKVLKQSHVRKETGDALLADYDYLLGLAWYSINDHNKAADYFHRHRQLESTRNTERLICLPPYDQYLVNALEINPRINAAVNLAWEMPEDTRVAELTATWLLNGRQLLGSVLEKQVSLQRRLVSQENSRLSQVNNESSEPAQTMAWRENEAILALEAAKTYRGMTSGNEIPWLLLSSIRDRLSEGEVLVLYARIRRVQWQSSKVVSGGARFGAWVIYPSCEVSAPETRFVDLGEAKKIDQTIEEWQKEVQDFNNGEFDRELSDDVHNKLNAISELIILPLGLENRVVDHDLTRIRVLPDSTLWMAPFAALPFKDKDFLVESVEFELLRSVHRLFAAHEENIEVTQSVMFGNPDFTNPPKADLSAADDKRYEAVSDALSATPAMRSDSRGKVQPLNYGDYDTKVVSEKLHKLYGERALVLTGSEASEAILRSCKRPLAMVLSTHGYYLPAKAASSDPDQMVALQLEKAASGDLSQHPWMRSGLILAGFNRIGGKESISMPADNDGDMTAYDVMRLDLRGTNLVVLAACSTGVGDTQTGESMACLWEAFHVAGAKEVVATLWDIPDTMVTSDFVADFLAKYEKQQSGVSALRDAQLDLIESLRGKKKSIHPVIWAGFVVTSR